MFPRFTSNPWDPYFRRDALELGLSPTATQATVPVGTYGVPGGLGQLYPEITFLGEL